MHNGVVASRVTIMGKTKWLRSYHKEGDRDKNTQ
jgi:hypothetical protein